MSWTILRMPHDNTNNPATTPTVTAHCVHGESQIVTKTATIQTASRMTSLSTPLRNPLSTPVRTAKPQTQSTTFIPAG